MRYLGGHLGTTVSALVDGQLDPASADRAWAHVHSCRTCARRVEREGWVKRQISSMSVEDRGDPPAQLLGSLYGLSGRGTPTPAADPSAAWAAVEEIERRERGRRRAGLAVVGAGSVSAAVLGFATLGGVPLGISGTPAAPPPTTAVSRPGSSATAMLAPTARVHGRLPEGTTGSAPRAD